MFFSRHFDQTECVEKSPKAKQYYPCKIPNLTVIQSVAWNLLERAFVFIVISTKRSAWRNPLRRSSTTFFTKHPSLSHFTPLLSKMRECRRRLSLQKKKHLRQQVFFWCPAATYPPRPCPAKYFLRGEA